MNTGQGSHRQVSHVRFPLEYGLTVSVVLPGALRGMQLALSFPLLSRLNRLFEICEYPSRLLLTRKPDICLILTSLFGDPHRFAFHSFGLN